MRAIIDKPEVEYLDGQPYPKMSPKATHSFVQGAFIRLLYRQGAAIGKCLPELRCHIGAVDDTKTEFVPDVAFILNDRWNALAPSEREEPPFSPDLVVEIRSPGENGRLRRNKIARYLATGAPIVFDVEPQVRTIHLHDAHGTRRLGKDDHFSDARFPWLTFDVSEVFADLDD
jgi:Uma2 family endonuclease